MFSLYRHPDRLYVENYKSFRDTAIRTAEENSMTTLRIGGQV